LSRFGHSCYYCYYCCYYYYYYYYYNYYYNYYYYYYYHYYHYYYLSSRAHNGGFFLQGGARATTRWLQANAGVRAG